jgi:hypothetical protein
MTEPYSTSTSTLLVAEDQSILLETAHLNYVCQFSLISEHDFSTFKDQNVAIVDVDDHSVVLVCSSLVRHANVILATTPNNVCSHTSVGINVTSGRYMRRIVNG